jgi:hypothetical protein
MDATVGVDPKHKILKDLPKIKKIEFPEECFNPDSDDENQDPFGDSTYDG